MNEAPPKPPQTVYTKRPNALKPLNRDSVPSVAPQKAVVVAAAAAAAPRQGVGRVTPQRAAAAAGVGPEASVEALRGTLGKRAEDGGPQRRTEPAAATPSGELPAVAGFCAVFGCIPDVFPHIVLNAVNVCAITQSTDTCLPSQTLDLAAHSPKPIVGAIAARMCRLHLDLWRLRGVTASFNGVFLCFRVQSAEVLALTSGRVASGPQRRPRGALPQLACAPSTARAAR